MEVLTTEKIELAWHEMDNMSLDNVPKLVKKLGHEQSYILAYLMATGSDILDQNEREALLFMGVMIWHITTSQLSKKIPEITGEVLDEKELKNMEMLEYLEGESETEFVDTVDVIMRKYRQADLLKFMIDHLMEESEKGVSIREENSGIIVIYLKTIIDCIDAVT